MRVLMLNYEFPPIGGGAANANKYLLEEFADRRDPEIHLVTSSPDGYWEESMGETVSIYRVDVSKDAIHYWTQPEILRYSWRAYRTSRQLADEFEYDLVHAWFGIPSGVIARALGLPYIVALRGSDVPGYNDRFEIQYTVLRPLIRHVWSEAEAVVANSRGLRNLAQQTARVGIEVIPNGVDVGVFEPTFPDNDTLEILCVSRLIERKGIQYLIRAIAETDAELTLVGEGNREAALRRLAERLGVEDRVTFAGYVPHDEVDTYYRQADVFVLPSFNEGMSNTLLEAMASGLPVVTTDTGGTDELVDGNGIVVPAGDSAAIADALSAYADGDLRQGHGERSRAIAEGLSWSSVARQYRELYRRTGA